MVTLQFGIGDAPPQEHLQFLLRDYGETDSAEEVAVVLHFLDVPECLLHLFDHSHCGSTIETRIAKYTKGKVSTSNYF